MARGRNIDSGPLAHHEFLTNEKERVQTKQPRGKRLNEKEALSRSWDSKGKKG